MDKGGRRGAVRPRAQLRARREERRMASTAPTADPVVGIDISARWFDAARGAQLRRFPNTDTGISACLRWLAAAGGAVRVGLEATGTYSLPLASALHAAGHPGCV